MPTEADLLVEIAQLKALRDTLRRQDQRILELEIANAEMRRLVNALIGSKASGTVRPER